MGHDSGVLQEAHVAPFRHSPKREAPPVGNNATGGTYHVEARIAFCVE